MPDFDHARALRDAGAYLKDLADRVFWTYAQTFLGLVTVAGFDVLSLSAWQAAGVAALPAAYAALKGAVAGFVNDPNTATFIRNRAAGKAGNPNAVGSA